MFGLKLQNIQSEDSEFISTQLYLYQIDIIKIIGN